MFYFLSKTGFIWKRYSVSFQDRTLSLSTFFYIVTLEQHAEQVSLKLIFTLLFSNAETTRSEQSEKEDTHIMSSVYFNPGSDSGVNG